MNIIYVLVPYFALNVQLYENIIKQTWTTRLYSTFHCDLDPVLNNDHKPEVLMELKTNLCLGILLADYYHATNNKILDIYVNFGTKDNI